MMRSLWTAASGMRAQQVNVDTISNNIANVNTTGYKTQTASFKSLLYQNLQSKSTNNVGDLKPVAAEVGLGTRVSAITGTFTQGNLQASDSPFHMAIEGDGFFTVRTPDGELRYTRDGSFSVSPTANGNLLCTAEGYPVLDQNGNNIVFPFTDVATNVIVSDQGFIGFPDETGNPAPLMNNGYEVKFGLVQFNNPAGLTKTSGTMYQESAASGPVLNEQNLNQNQRSVVHQGYLEGSNVQVADEMVNLIVAQRAYEMNSKAIQAADEMMGQANSLRR